MRVTAIKSLLTYEFINSLVHQQAMFWNTSLEQNMSASAAGRAGTQDIRIRSALDHLALSLC